MDINYNSDKYITLLLDREQLIKSSKRMIRKSKSSLARQIDKGNVKAIIKASKDKVFGTLNKAQRRQLCKILCDLKSKLINVVRSDMKRELISYAIQAAIGLFDTASGLIISLLWIIREKIDNVICTCRLDGQCSKGTCVSYNLED